MMLSLSVGLIGVQTVFRQKHRIRQLTQCADFIQTVSTEIGYGCFPLTDILHRAAENEAFSALPFLKSVEREITTGFSLAWKTSIENATSLALRKEEKAILIQFGKHLGTTDTDTQLVICERYRVQFAQRSKDASMRFSDGKRLYYGCFAIASLLLFTLIL
ncbi:MAG TPA: hypothetical protein DDY98_07960 [Ruminococcaceae bacterium]|nr:hypothetical protein [Oscillospiraceae bacterium]